MLSLVRKWILVGTAVLFAALEAELGHAVSDNEYSDNLIGTWSATYTDERQGEIEYFEKTYCPNGTASGSITYYKEFSEEIYREYEKVFFKSRWYIQKNVLVIFDIVFYPEPWTGPDVLTDRIVELTEDKAMFVDLEGGHEFERFRDASSDWRQKCSGTLIM